VKLAQDLGANFIHIVNDDRVEGWSDFALKERIKHIVMDYSDITLYERIFNSYPVNTINRNQMFDLHLISNSELE